MAGKQKIKDLIDLVESSSVSEIEISSFWGFKKIRVSRLSANTSAVPQVAPAVQSVTAPVQAEKTGEEPSAELEGNQVEIKAPLVGTYYSAGKPGAPPFVKLGDTISVGQPICIIEAMKIFNEIEAEVSGKIVKILVNNEQPVEYDQTLMIVETS